MSQVSAEERRYPYYYEVLREPIVPTEEQKEKGMRIAKGLAQVATAFEGMRGHYDYRGSFDRSGLLVIPESPIERTVDYTNHLGWNRYPETTVSMVPLIVVYFETTSFIQKNSLEDRFTGEAKIKGIGPSYPISKRADKGVMVREEFSEINLNEHTYALIENIKR